MWQPAPPLRWVRATCGREVSRGKGAECCSHSPQLTTTRVRAMSDGALSLAARSAKVWQPAPPLRCLAVTKVKDSAAEKVKCFYEECDRLAEEEA